MGRLRSTGMSIAEMREYTKLVKLGASTLGQRRAMLSVHQQRIAQTIAELTLASRLVEEKIAYYEEWTATGIEPVDLPASKWGEPGPGTVVQLSARRRGTI